MTRAIVLILTNLIWICLTIWYVIQYLSRGSSPSFPVTLPYCLDIPLLYILIKSNCWRNFPAFGLNFKLMTPDSVFMANDLWLVKVKMWILPFKRDLNSKVLVINEGHEEFQLRQYVKLSQTAIWSLAEHRSVHQCMATIHPSCYGTSVLVKNEHHMYMFRCFPTKHHWPWSVAPHHEPHMELEAQDISILNLK